MKTENQAEKLEKQGRGLTIFLKILGVILLLLNLILLDQEFVPWGKTWEKIKQEYPEEDVAGMTDKELWTAIKDEAEEVGIPRSGFLCWGVLLYRWNEHKAKEAERERLLRQADENAKAVMATVSEFLAENGIETDSLEVLIIRIHNNDWKNDLLHIASSQSILDESERKRLEELLSEAVPVTEDGSAKAYILGNKCTAAALAFRADNVVEGTDYPYLDENGHFDTEREWGYGWSEVHMHGFLIQYVDENGIDHEK